MLLHFAGEALDVPPGAVVGVLGEDTKAVSELLAQVPESQAHCFAYNFDLLNAYARLEAHHQLESLRRAGAVSLVASHQEELLRLYADEIWWVDESRLRLRGTAAEAIAAYQRHVSERFRRSIPQGALHPRFRRGDGRAELISIDLLNAARDRVSTVATGEQVAICVGVRYTAGVTDPVVGVMIRTRIGMEVYGTNTELEKVQVGPCGEGDVRLVDFDFRCDLCPGRYTLTAASHDPDGVWHDWMEDAAAFTVTADRYTAGVANLRARVSVTTGSRE